MWRWVIRIAVALLLVGVAALGIGVWYASRLFNQPPEYYSGHKEIRAWWDWPNTPDHRLYYFPMNDIVVLDSARHIVYIGHRGSF
jgi:hypothetical protein